jgi:lipoprotein-anchoring transpeptidase ErfK/SrfK
MRTRTFFMVAGFLTVLLIGAGAVYAYDAGRQDRIADGVRVGGVSVGGMTTAQARLKLRRAVLEPLSQPVVASYKGRRFTLTPEQARVGVNIDSSVDAALDRSRSGGLFARTWRSVTGEEVQAELDLDITYSEAAIKQVVSRVRSRIDEAPVEATVNLDGGSVEVKTSREGLEVRRGRLARDLEAALLSRDVESRAVRIRARPVAPNTSTEDLSSKYPAIVIVNRGTFKLTLYKNLKPAKTYRIAVGQAGLDTPAGLYHIQNKAENPAWHVPDSEWAGKLAGKVIGPDDPRNPIEARWMGIYDGAGIHGTTADASIGTAASHGCIRMRIPEVIELYEQVPVGAPIYIS